MFVTLYGFFYYRRLYNIGIVGKERFMLALQSTLLGELLHIPVIYKKIVTVVDIYRQELTIMDWGTCRDRVTC